MGLPAQAELTLSDKSPLENITAAKSYLAEFTFNMQTGEAVKRDLAPSIQAEYPKIPKHRQGTAPLPTMLVMGACRGKAAPCMCVCVCVGAICAAACLVLAEGACAGSSKASQHPCCSRLRSESSTSLAALASKALHDPQITRHACILTS